MPASELGGAGVFSLSVSEVSFRAANSDSVSFESFSVFMGTAFDEELVDDFCRVTTEVSGRRYSVDRT